MGFIPGLELSRMLYEEHIRSMMEEHFPDLKYAAGVLGMCSEVHGFDDEVSMDHMWGVRAQIYLSPEDLHLCGKQIYETLRKNLPLDFKGYEMTWKRPDVEIQDTSEHPMYTVGVSTTRDTLRFYGVSSEFPLQDTDWLQISEQHLFEFTSGEIFRDDLGELTQAREELKHYPDEVLRFLLAQGWAWLSGDWAYIGRTGGKGDLLGMHILTARVVQHLMRIAFMVSRNYFPYQKWFGSAFKRLRIASDLEPALHDILHEDNWRRAEESVLRAASMLLDHQNRLGLFPELSLEAQISDKQRNHFDMDYFWASGKMMESVRSPALRKLIDNVNFWLSERTLILHNHEHGKWLLLNQKGE